MQKFSDSTGDEWTISLNIFSVKKIKTEVDVDLLDLESGDTPTLGVLLTDEMKLAEVIFTLLDSQMTKKGIAIEELQERFDGKTLAASTQAFFDELQDFFSARGRKDRVKAVDKAITMMESLIAQAEAEVDKIDIDKIKGQINQTGE